jgi:DNA polymerase I-like protein with 3'-5' exonuclease and polymerase domains
MCTVPQLSQLDLKDVDTVAVDLETYDPELIKKGSGAVKGIGSVCGIAIATKKQTLYFPINHAHTDNLNPQNTWKILNKKLFQNKDIRKVFHNAMYDVCWIRAESGLMPQGPLLDTMVAASVIDENRMKYSLDSLSKDYLEDTKYKYDLRDKVLEWSKGTIKDPMTNMHKLPYALVKDYAEQDVNLTLRLWNLFEKKIDEEKVVEKGTKDEKVKTLRHIFELETELFPCLVHMKFKGVRINEIGAKKLGERLQRTKNNIVNYIHRRTGIRIEIWAASSIKKLLDKLKIKDYKTTPKSKLPQLPKDYLKTHENHFIRFIAKAREFDKAENTFVEGLLNFVHKGRIHADINQIRGEKGGTITGRFSMSNPNLQQIPAKGFIGKKMRELFLPEEGCSWGSFDYSQQEPRLVVHYAVKLKGCNIGTERVVESYKNDPDTDFHQVVADMAHIPRITAKTINLGLFYGMGKNRLAQQLGLNWEESKILFNKYHKEAPFVKKLSSSLEDFAKRNMFLYTLENRFCRFDKWEPMEKRWKPKEKKFIIKVVEEVIETDKKTKKQKKIKREVEKPVPLFSKEEAKIHYKAMRSDKGYPPDETCKYFTNFYQPAFVYKALNKLIQGSAADMTKKAMVLLYRKGILPHIQIHDELCISIKNTQQAEKIKKIMETVIKLEVPNKVDYEFGPNWGTLKEK